MPVTINGSNTPTAGGVTYGDGTQYANTAAGSAGGVLYSAGSSAPAFTAAGSSGQVLTSAGASAPTWSTPSAGALVFISSQTVSTAVASVDFTSGISSTYDDYQIIFENVTQSASNANLRFLLYQSGAFQTSYTVINTVALDGGVNSSNLSVAQAYIGSSTTGSPSISTTNWRGYLLLQNVNSATIRTVSLTGTVSSLGSSTTHASLQQITGASNTAAVVTGFRIAFSSGNLSSGTVRLYGIAKV